MTASAGPIALESVTTLHRAAIALATASAIVHLVLGIVFLPHWMGAAFLLAAGAARYLVVLGTWWRERRGRRVLESPSNRFRRPLGALAVVAVWIALLPVLGQRVSYVVATVVMVPFLVNFCWDWLAITGSISDSRTACAAAS